MGWKWNGHKEQSTIIYNLQIKNTDNSPKFQYL